MTLCSCVLPHRSPEKTASVPFLAGLPSWDPMAVLTGLFGSFAYVRGAVSQRCFSTSGSLSAIQKMTRVRVVDNSALGNTPYHRPPRCIHVYNKSGVGKVGDQILLAIRGQKKKALIVGHRMPGSRMTPKFDSNCAGRERGASRDSRAAGCGACGFAACVRLAPAAHRRR